MSEHHDSRKAFERWLDGKPNHPSIRSTSGDWMWRAWQSAWQIAQKQSEDSAPEGKRE